MKAINIEWDVTNNDMTQEEMEEMLEILPSEMEIPNDLEEDEIVDYISDVGKFFVFDFDIID